MNILDGRQAKIEILKSLKVEIEKLNTKLGLVVIQVGEDPASSVYVRQKETMAASLNYNFSHYKLKEDIREEELLNLISKLNQDDNIDGILVQMPIPRHLNVKRFKMLLVH